MRRPYHKLFYHLVWATYDRLPLIKAEYESRLYSGIRLKVKELKGQVIAVNGLDDHVHVLLRLGPTLSISEILKGIKGSSSHLMNHEIMRDETFKWQGYYGAFSVSPTSLDKVKEYVDNQKQRHDESRVFDDWEECFIED